ncbi:cytochrome c [Sphingomonas flavescens]|uniref:c-type cytochrome n=1 Tax=Sphingomonas flavescens TaxID=3132797 RepID=UPI00280658E6|nr:cytochrome c [Sphingomonas limnosediminicola]
MRIVPIAVATLAAIAATAGVAAVSGTKAKQIAHERHEGMENIGKQFKALRREFDSPAPNAAAVKASADQVASLAAKSSTWFAKGSGPEVGKNGAKPEIWQNWPDFVAKNRAFQQSAQAFKAIAAKGDLTAAKASYGDLAGTCKACHDKYRAEMKH